MKYTLLLLPLLFLTVYGASAIEGESSSYRMSGTLSFPTVAPVVQSEPAPTPAQPAPTPAPVRTPMPAPAVRPAAPRAAAPVTRPAPVVTPKPEEPVTVIEEVIVKELVVENALLAQFREEVLDWMYGIQTEISEIRAEMRSGSISGDVTSLRSSAYADSATFRYEIVVGVGFGVLMIGILLMLLQQPKRRR